MLLTTRGEVLVRGGLARRQSFSAIRGILTSHAVFFDPSKKTSRSCIRQKNILLDEKVYTLPVWTKQPADHLLASFFQ